MVNVAWRVYHPDGDKKDGDNKTFFGWDETFDEWIPLQSAIIAPLHTHSSQTMENMTNESQTKKPSVDSNEDEDRIDETLDD